MPMLLGLLLGMIDLLADWLTVSCLNPGLRMRALMAQATVRVFSKKGVTTLLLHGFFEPSPTLSVTPPAHDFSPLRTAFRAG